ncbi:Chromatin assembly factor 1 subunit B, partial [Gonapodya sp. JEL0774]
LHIGPGGVNAVRWSPNGETLASGGDDRAVILWRRILPTQSSFALSEGATSDRDPSSKAVTGGLMGNDDDEAAEEEWKAVRTIRGARAEIYDLSWSPCGRFIAAACIDNTVMIFNVENGVAWDPLGEYLASQGSDRTMIIYRTTYTGPTKKLAVTLFVKHSRAPLASQQTTPGNTLATSTASSDSLASFTEPVRASSQPDISILASVSTSSESSLPNHAAPVPAVSAATQPRKRHPRLFLPDTIGTFFRRCGWTPDGSVLIGVSGSVGNGAEDDETAGKDVKGKGKEKETTDKEAKNTSWMWGRGNLSGSPIAHLSTPRKASVAFRSLALPLNPTLNPAGSNKPFLALPGYRIISAVATLDGVTVYDSERTRAIAMVSGVHEAGLTDCAWAPDATCLVVSSMDGYCSIVDFAPGELGDVIDRSKWPGGRWVGLEDVIKKDNCGVETEPKEAVLESQEVKKDDGDVEMEEASPASVEITEMVTPVVDSTGTVEVENTGSNSTFGQYALVSPTDTPSGGLETASAQTLVYTLLLSYPAAMPVTHAPVRVVAILREPPTIPPAPSFSAAAEIDNQTELRIEKIDDRTVGMWTAGASEPARRGLHLVLSAANPDTTHSAAELDDLADMACHGFNAALVTFSLGTTQSYDRSYHLSRVVKQLSHVCATLKAESSGEPNLEIRFAYIALTDVKCVDLVSGRTMLDLPKGGLESLHTTAETADEIIDVVQTGTALPSVLSVRITHRDGNVATGNLLLFDLGRPSFSTSSSHSPGLHRGVGGLRRLVDQLARTTSAASPTHPFEIGSGEGADGRVVRVLGDYLGGNARVVVMVDVEDPNPLDPRVAQLRALGERLKKEGEEITAKLAVATAASNAADQALVATRQDLARAKSQARKESEAAKRNAGWREWEAGDEVLKARIEALALQREIVSIQVKLVVAEEEARREKMRTIDVKWRSIMKGWQGREWAMKAKDAESRYELASSSLDTLRHVHEGTSSALAATREAFIVEHQRLTDSHQDHVNTSANLSAKVTEIESQADQLTARLERSFTAQKRLQERIRELEMEQSLHAREQAASDMQRDAAAGARDAMMRERDALLRELELVARQKETADKEVSAAQKELSKLQKRMSEAIRSLEDEKGLLEERIAQLIKEQLTEVEAAKRDVMKLKGENEVKGKLVDVAAQAAKEEVERVNEARKREREKAREEKQRLETRVRELELKLATSKLSLRSMDVANAHAESRRAELENMEASILYDRACLDRDKVKSVRRDMADVSVNDQEHVERKVPEPVAKASDEAEGKEKAAEKAKIPLVRKGLKDPDDDFSPDAVVHKPTKAVKDKEPKKPRDSKPPPPVGTVRVTNEGHLSTSTKAKSEIATTSPLTLSDPVTIVKQPGVLKPKKKSPSAYPEPVLLPTEGRRKPRTKILNYAEESVIAEEPVVSRVPIQNATSSPGEDMDIDMLGGVEVGSDPGPPKVPKEVAPKKAERPKKHVSSDSNFEQPETSKVSRKRKIGGEASSLTHHNNQSLVTSARTTSEDKVDEGEGQQQKKRRVVLKKRSSSGPSKENAPPRSDSLVTATEVAKSAPTAMKPSAILAKSVGKLTTPLIGGLGSVPLKSSGFSNSGGRPVSGPGSSSGGFSGLAVRPNGPVKLAKGLVDPRRLQSILSG